eukprot:11059856-Alexandrium_andersonii.AAC.1
MLRPALVRRRLRWRMEGHCQQRPPPRYSVVDQLVAAIGENSEPAMNEIMKIVDAASTLFAEPQK